MEQSSNSIAEQTGFNKQRVMRAVTKIRLVMIKDVPEIFFGTVEMDETYFGGQWKNKRRSAHDQGSKRGRGTTKQPVFGILCRNGTFWAEVVEDFRADTLQPLISKKWGEQYNYASTVIFMTQCTIQNGDYTGRPQKTLYLLK